MRRIARLHGGDAIVASQPGCFRVTIPANAA
jgi:signal transduction histidine kinase